MCKEFVMQRPGRQAGSSTGCNNKFHYTHIPDLQPKKEKAFFYLKDETMNIICEVLSLLKGEIEVFYSPGQGG